MVSRTRKTGRRLCVVRTIHHKHGWPQGWVVIFPGQIQRQVRIFTWLPGVHPVLRATVYPLRHVRRLSLTRHNLSWPNGYSARSPSVDIRGLHILRSSRLIASWPKQLRQLPCPWWSYQTLSLDIEIVTWHGHEFEDSVGVRQLDIVNSFLANLVSAYLRTQHMACLCYYKKSDH
jgi:hypothetical protein